MAMKSGGNVFLVAMEIGIGKQDCRLDVEAAPTLTFSIPLRECQGQGASPLQQEAVGK